MDSANEQDSIFVQIEPSQQERRITVQPQRKLARELINYFQLKFTAQHQKLDLYFTCNPIYMQNLIIRKQIPNIPTSKRNLVGRNCVLYKQFKLSPKHLKAITGQQQSTEMVGNIHINVNPMVNIQFKVCFERQIKRPQDFIWMTMQHCVNGVWKSKGFSFELDKDKKYFVSKIPYEEFNDLIEPNMLVNVTLRRKQASNSDHLGIINLGNTCFMNSCLQMMFYIRPLRKIVLDSKSTKPLIKALRKVFIMMMDIEQKRPVDIEFMLSLYDKYNEQPRRQQDVQQFLLDFINEIESECEQAKHLWQGKATQTTYSKQKSKQYKSTLTEQFAQLDVHLFDRQKRFYSRIQDSLKELMEEEQVDEMIDHDQYGKIKVAKYRRFQILPQVLFVNLKRYEWNKQKMRLSKIFSHISYGEQLNLGFLLGTPGGDEQINPQCDYSLFSVLVHKGTSPQNGHYFVFVNTSNTSREPAWMCFNDSIVTKSDLQEVLGFTGKKNVEIVLDKNAGKFVQKEIESDASSYLLVYIRKAVFDSYQGIKTSIPKDYIKEKIKKQAERQKENLQDVNVLAFDGFENEEEEINLFNPEKEYMQIPLPKNESLIQQLTRVSKSIFSMQAKYFYRVYVNEKKVKIVQPYETANEITTYRRGFQQPTYILILSNKTPHIAQQITKNEQLGIVKIVKDEMNQFQLPSIGLITQRYLKQLEDSIEKKGGKVNFTDNDAKQDFYEGWNKFIEIQVLR